MNSIVRNTNTLFLLIWNKLPLILLLLLQVKMWQAIPDGSDVPFASARYALIVMNAGAVAIPLCRWLLFPEAAFYAEQGGLTKDLEDKRATTTDATKHYWFATTVSTLIVAVAFFAKA